MATISSLMNLIRTAIYGKDVREAIADGIEAINTEVEDTTERQDDLEATFGNLIINAGNSNAELVAARHDNINNINHNTLGARMDAVSSSLADITSKLISDFLKAYEPRTIIYVHPTLTIVNGKPAYQTLKQAIESITDNSILKPYVIKVYYSNYTDIGNITLKDYVDIEGVFNKDTDFMPVITMTGVVGSESLYDLLKTSDRADVYNGGTADFPIHCKIKGVHFKVKDANYCMHIDFNRNKDIDIEVEDCILEHLSNTSNTDYGYSLGIGEYAEQKIKFKNCKLIGVAYSGKQVSSFVWHNRDNQYAPCTFVLDNCDCYGSNYGGRFISYNSGHSDSIKLYNNRFHGKLGSLLFLNNTSTTKFWGNVDAKWNILDVVHYDFAGTLATEFRLHSEGFTKKYLCDTAVTEGQIVVSADAVGYKVVVAGTSLNYKNYCGVVHKTTTGAGEVIVQIKGIVKITTDTALSAQTLVGNSLTSAGNCQSVTGYENSLGCVVTSTSQGNKASVILKNVMQ